MKTCFHFVVFIFLLGCTAFSQDFNSGSTIAVYRTPDSIVVAADSRATNPSNPSDFKIVCKIRKVGNTYFANAGVFEYSFTKFNLTELATQALLAGGTFSEKVKRFESLIAEPLRQTVQAIRAREKSTDAVLNSLRVGIVFFAIENNVPYLALRRFEPTRDLNAMDIIRLDCPGSDCNTSNFVALLGHRGAAQSRTWDKGRYDHGIANGLKGLIQLEVAANPQSVGAPVDIIALGKQGARWVERKPECYSSDK